MCVLLVIIEDVVQNAEETLRRARLWRVRQEGSQDTGPRGELRLHRRLPAPDVEVAVALGVVAHLVVRGLLRELVVLVAVVHTFRPFSITFCCVGEKISISLFGGVFKTFRAHP